MGILTINNAACSVVIYPVGYGLLYNCPAVTDVKNITSSDDWVVPTVTQYETLLNLLGTRSSNSWEPAGDKLKETGEIYWVGNETATNEAGFNARGAGERTTAGIFQQLNTNNYIRTS